MNWSKAKTILIIALIITDVFLLLTYGDFGFKPGEFKDNKALSEFLTQKNIYVDAEMIPQKHSDMPVLFVHNEEIDHDKISRDFKVIDTALLQPNDIAKNAALDRVEHNGEYTKVIYKNVIKNITLEKSYIELTFKNGELEEISCEWLEVERFHNKKQKTISAAEALLLFMTQNEDKKSIYIDSIEMIYWLDERSIDTQTAVSADTAFPVWKIAYNGADAAYINAYEY